MAGSTRKQKERIIFDGRSSHSSGAAVRCQHAAGITGKLTLLPDCQPPMPAERTIDYSRYNSWFILSLGNVLLWFAAIERAASGNENSGTRCPPVARMTIAETPEISGCRLIFSTFWRGQSKLEDLAMRSDLTVCSDA